MICKIVKLSGDKALKYDVGRLDVTKVPEEVTEIKDIPYLEDGIPGHTIDIYLKEDGIKKPILIDIHGGGFVSEDKAMNRLFGCYMAKLGFAVFEINFRIAYPEYTVFDQIEDIDNAVRFVLKNCDKYEGDKEQLYIAGHSSGCVLATAECLLSLDSYMRADYGIKERDYQYKGLITDCGLMHFYKSGIAYGIMRKMIFPKDYKNDKRYKYLLFEDNKSISLIPKVALITNSKDALRKMTFHFTDILEKNNVKHQVFREGADGHTGIIFVPYKEHNIETLQKIKEWFLA